MYLGSFVFHFRVCFLFFLFNLLFEYVKHLHSSEGETKRKDICRNLIYIPFPLLCFLLTPLYVNIFVTFWSVIPVFFSFKNKMYVYVYILFSYTKGNILYILFCTSFFFSTWQYILESTPYWYIHRTWYIQVFLILLYGGIIFRCVDIS